MSERMTPDLFSSRAASNPTTLSGSQIVWEVLVRQGVEVVFGYPGGTIMPVYDALTDYPVHHVLVRHEQSAAHMADGYARASGRVGVAFATSGPGSTNLVTGIATAMMDSVPLVCITGQVPSTLLGSDAFQETDITGVTLPITKHNYLVTRTEDVAPTLREAFHVASSGRPGPVLVDITKDAQQGKCPFLWSDEPPKLRGFRPEHRLEPETLEEALRLIGEASRPVILAGNGVVRAGAAGLLRELVDRHRIPVASTLLGLGSLPAGHPCNLGMMGMHGEAWVNGAIQQADLLVALGMRFDDRVTGRVQSYAPQAKKIHVELDPAEVNKNVKVDLAIVGDLCEVVEALLPRIATQDLSPWLAQIERVRGEAAPRDIQQHREDGRLHAAQVIADLCHLTGDAAVLVTDVGQHQMWTAQYYRHSFPRHLITSGGLGTMGFGLPAAVGASFARPDAEIWCIVGDGGFQMTAAELSTCAQEDRKIRIAVINNGYLGMVRQWQELFFEKRYVQTNIRGPDFVKLAEAHGLTGLRVTERSEVGSAVAQAREAPGTVVIDFRVEQHDLVYPMVPAGAAINEMLRRPLPEAARGESRRDAPLPWSGHGV